MVEYGTSNSTNVETTINDIIHVMKEKVISLNKLSIFLNQKNKTYFLIDIGFGEQSVCSLILVLSNSVIVLLF